MADGTRRRPLPALISLLALTLLTALVWWRVLSRHDGNTSAHNQCSAQSAPTILPQPGSVSLSVYNSTNRTGIAKTAASILSKDGFKVLGYQNDPANLLVPGVAEIRYSIDQKTAATLLSYYLPGAKLVALSATANSQLVVSLGSQYKAVATSTVAHDAITSAHVSQMPVGTTSSPVAVTTC